MRAEPFKVDSWWAHLAWFAATGVLLALAFPLPGWGWLGLVALAPAAVAVGGSGSPRRVWVAAFVVFSLWFGWMLRWLWPVTGPGVLALAPFTALFPASALWAANLATTRGKAPLVLALPVCWVAGEWLRSVQPWGGFGWFLLGHSNAASGGGGGSGVFASLLGPLAGAPAVSFALALLAAALAAVLAPRGSSAGPGRKRAALGWRVALLSLVPPVAMVLLALNALARSAERQREAVGPSVPVAALQTNNPHSNRVAPTYETLASEYRTLAGLHREAAEHDPPPVLILWPETIVPGPFNRDERGLDQSPFAGAARALIEECGIPTVVGGSYSLEAEGSPRHNSAFFVVPGEEQERRHDKVHRVPFGEYIPGPAWLKELVLDRFSPYDFDYTLTPGVLGEPFELRVRATERGRELPVERVLRFATPICFEDTDPALTRAMAGGGAQALLNLTTSGWFGRMPSPEDPGGGLAWRSVRAQHLQIASFRSLETGLPTLRAVNTGDSALVTGGGFVRAALPPGEPGVLRAELPLVGGGGRTVYLRGGYLFAPANAVFATLLLGWGLLRCRLHP